MIIEILRYRLKPGTAGDFAKTMQSQSEVLQRRAGIEILAHGALEGDAQGYVLIRRFTDRETMDRELGEFYASANWRNGPRQTIVDAIASSDQLIIADVSSTRSRSADS